MPTPAAIPSAPAAGMMIADVLNVASKTGAGDAGSNTPSTAPGERSTEPFEHLMARALVGPAQKQASHPAQPFVAPATKAGPAPQATPKDGNHEKTTGTPDKTKSPTGSKDDSDKKSDAKSSETNPASIVPLIIPNPSLPAAPAVVVSNKTKNNGDAKPASLPGAPASSRQVQPNENVGKMPVLPATASGAAQPSIPLSANSAADARTSKLTAATRPTEPPTSTSSANPVPQTKTDGQPQAKNVEAINIKEAASPPQPTKIFPPDISSSPVQPDAKTPPPEVSTTTSVAQPNFPGHPAPATPTPSAATVYPTPPDHPSVADHSTITGETAAKEPSAVAQTSEDSFQPAGMKTTGTAVAQEASAMKNTAQQNKVAGPTEKVLPGDSRFAADRKNSPTPEATSPDSHAEAPITLTSGQPSTDKTQVTAMNQDVSGATTKTSADTVERTHDAVAMNAIRLQETGAASLRVVIKPDAGTQLSLELRQHDGGVEAQAVLQNGDFSHLNHHWHELQQRLEQRGVKLAPLTSEQSLDFSGNNQSHFQPPARHSVNEETVGAHRSGHFVTANMADDSRATTPARRSTHQGWETWA